MEYLFDVPGNRLALWRDTAWVEIQKNFEQFFIFDDRKWAAAIGDPESDLEPMACWRVLRAGSIDCQGAGLTRIGG